MSFCLLASLCSSIGPGLPLPPGDVHRLELATTAAPGLTAVHIHEPGSADDPFVGPEAAPSLVLQLYVKEFQAIARAVLHVETILGRPAASCITASYEAMSVQTVAPRPPGTLPAEHTSYLVAYAGVPEDIAAWHRHYETRHVPLMLRLPGLIGLEILKPVDGAMPVAAGLTRSSCFQRNRVMFASPAALTGALRSPIRAEMRADFHALPRYTGASSHYPVRTRVIRPAEAPSP